MKFIVSSSGTEIDFSKIKDPVTFPDSNSNSEISIELNCMKYLQINLRMKKKA